MKMSIKWHRECLKNIGNRYDTEKSALLRQQNKVSKLAWELEHLREQINSALDKKKDGFDDERFMKMENPYESL